MIIKDKDRQIILGQAINICAARFGLPNPRDPGHRKTWKEQVNGVYEVLLELYSSS